MVDDNLAQLVSVTYQRTTASDPSFKLYYMATVTFAVTGARGERFDVPVVLDMSKHKQEDLVRVGRVELHRLFTHLAETTKEWDLPPA